MCDTNRWSTPYVELIETIAVFKSTTALRAVLYVEIVTYFSVGDLGVS